MLHKIFALIAGIGVEKERLPRNSEGQIGLASREGRPCDGEVLATDVAPGSDDVGNDGNSESLRCKRGHSVLGVVQCQDSFFPIFLQNHVFLSVQKTFRSLKSDRH